MAMREPGKGRDWLQPAALLLTIPGFYLMLDGQTPVQQLAGQVAYGLAALLLAMHMLMPASRMSVRLARQARRWGRFDAVLLVCIAANLWPSMPPWSNAEWFLRLVACGVISIRMVSLAVGYMGPRSLAPTCAVSLAMLAMAGGGFYWLEPQVHSFADGLWLAFTTGATVGYGDIVPSTPASKVFAVFIVLMGYALLSLVTASIAALLVGEDEKLIRRELHADMRLLLREIDALRGEIAAQRGQAPEPAVRDGES